MSNAVRSIKDLKTPGDLWGLRNDNKQARSRLEILWKLGLAFYRGRQYTYYSTALKRLQQLPMDDQKPRGKTRLVSNQIKPNCNKLVAKLTKTKPQFTATAGNGDPKSQKAARLAESAAEYWWDALDIQRKYRQALTWGRVAGQGYWLITWDKYAGQPFQYLCHPQTGDPVPQDHQAEYATQITSLGGNPQDMMKTGYQGDLSIEVLSPLNVWLDNTVEEFGDIRYWGVDRHLDPDEIFTRWGQKVEANSVITDADLGAQTSDIDTAKKSVSVVCTLYIKPCPTLPAGRVVTFTQDKILEDNQWNFPFKICNLLKFGSTPIPNSPYDSGEVEDAIPLNKELNKTISQALTHRDLTVNPKWLVPRNANQSFNTADEILSYVPVGTQIPTQVKHEPLPSYLKDILVDMNDRIKQCFGLNDVSSGVAPAGMESGIAMDLAQEASDEVIAPIVLDNEISLGKALQICLELARVYYTDERLLTITGENGRPQIVAFKGSRVPDNIMIHTEASSSMPRTRAGRLARVMLLKQWGLLPPGTEYKYLDNPDLKGWKQEAMLDEDMADREIEKLKDGIPLNPIALQEAQGQMASMPGKNPQTGQPWQSPQEAQAFILAAMLSPSSYENYDAHYASHTKYMKSVEYESLPLQLQHEIKQHTDATLKRIIDIQEATKERSGNVKVTLGAHEVLGPQAVAAILEEAGVQNVTAEQLATEPPLDSLVIENKTPPTSGSGSKSGGSSSPSPKQPSMRTQRHAGGV